MSTLTNTVYNRVQNKRNARTDGQNWLNEKRAAEANQVADPTGLHTCINLTHCGPDFSELDTMAIIGFRSLIPTGFIPLDGRTA